MVLSDYGEFPYEKICFLHPRVRVGPLCVLLQRNKIEIAIYIYGSFYFAQCPDFVRGNKISFPGLRIRPFYIVLRGETDFDHGSRIESLIL